MLDFLGQLVLEEAEVLKVLTAVLASKVALAQQVIEEAKELASAVALDFKAAMASKAALVQPASKDRKALAIEVVQAFKAVSVKLVILDLRLLVSKVQ